ncbi:hypothetical protein NDU88_004952 [Pleurodeles waltl]|uniref:GAGE domain-containing protein n=1 Tax=Pleurodeles waltl TaxID=8319 RepID=A0AAV7SKA3_PLEWA|nr:hypothetical protein NDU88_004952 [Pleurodeles waltl]
MQTQSERVQEGEEEDTEEGNAGQAEEKPEPQQRMRAERIQEIKPDSSADQNRERETPRDSHTTVLEEHG